MSSSDRITLSTCGHEVHPFDTIAGMCLPCWRERCAEYSRRMAEIPPERKQHALCDHANGYCAA